MIEIISRKFKPTDIDQQFMDECAELERNHPNTWNKYNMDYSGINEIINMEYNELMNAVKNKNHEEYRENIIHLSTALLYAWRITDAWNK